MQMLRYGCSMTSHLIDLNRPERHCCIPVNSVRVCVQGVMFVVDASCAEFDETKSTLHEVLGKTRPKIPVLILANKSDVQGAHKPEELKDKLSVGTGSGRTTAVLSCCGIKNEGLQASRAILLHIVLWYA